MRKVLLFLFAMSVFSATSGQVTTLWEKSDNNGTLPTWFDTGNLTRGFDYGEIGGEERLFVVSRNGGNFIYILDAASGDSLGHLDATGIAGGTYNVSDVAVSDDGVVFVCNLAINGEFRVYQYNDISAAYSAVITADGTNRRLGDKFEITGRLDDNSIIIWAASGSSQEVLKITTTDNGANWSTDVVNINATGGSASAYGLADGSFYYNAGGINVKKYDASGNELGTVDGSIVSTGSNSIQYITTKEGDEFFATFAYGADNENARIGKVVGGDLSATELYAVTPSLYQNGNVGGTGDVSVKDNGDDTYTLYVLSTNNGLGAYKLEFINILNLTIAEIQTTPDLQSGPSPYVDEVVKTSGIVTGVEEDGFFIQDGAGEWNGVWVYNPGATVAVGDDVTVTGTVVEYFDLTEIDDITEIIVNSSGNPAPDIYMTTTIGFQVEALEGVLVGVENAECVNPDLNHGEWGIDDGSGEGRVDDVFFAYVPTLGNIYNVTGIVNYSFDNFKIEPGNADDIIDLTVPPLVYSPQNVNGEVVGSNVELTWESGDPDTSISLSNFVASSGFYHAAEKAYGSIIDLTGFVSPTVTKFDFAQGGFDFFEGEAKYIAHALDMDAQTVLYSSDTLTADVPFSGVVWERVDLPDLSGVTTLGLFIESLTPDSFGDVWPTLFTDDQIPPPAGGNVRIEDLTDIFNNVTNPASTELGAFVINVYLDHEGVTGISTPINPSGTPSSEEPRKAERFSILPHAGGTIEAVGYNIYKGDDPAAMQMIGSVDIQTYSYTDEGIAYGTYYYGISAAAGEEESEITSVMVDNPFPEPDSLYTYWEMSAATGNLPSYFSSDSYERGMAYGHVNGNDRLYVVTRNGGPRIVVHDAANGQEIGTIPAPTPAVGYFPLNYIDVSDDGYIFACNMTLTANDANAFTVYMWSSEDATPQVVVSETTTNARMGDKFSVYGSVEDNTIAIYAGLSNQSSVMKYTTVDNGATFTGEMITLEGATVGTSPMVAQVPDGSFYFKSYGKPMVYYNADGTVIDTISTAVLGTAVATVKFTGDVNEHYLICTEPDEDGAGDGEYLYVVDVSEGVENALRVAYTASLGNVPNGNAGGACDYMEYAEDVHVFFILGTNNGIGAFSTEELSSPPVLYAPGKLNAVTSGANVELTWETGDPDSTLSLSSFVALSGFYHAAQKAYGSIYDLSGFTNPVIKKFDFAQGGFDFFEGDVGYIVYVYDMDAQTVLYTSDTLSAEVPFSGAVWERVNLPNISGVTTLGIFIESLTEDSAGDVWPTIFTDDQVPVPAGGNVRIEDLTDPFNNVTNPGNSELGAFLFNVYLNYEDVTGVSTPIVLSGTPTNEKPREADSFIFPAISNVNVEAVGYNIYRGENAGAMEMIGSVDIMTNTYVDADVASGIYYYGVTTALGENESAMTVITFVHTPVGVEDETGLPEDFAIYQNYPNPFNPATTIKFALPMESNVRVVVYNLLGEVVRELSNLNYKAGYHHVNFNASNLSSGIYFYSIEASAVDGSDNFKEVRKMMLLK
ncbi:MAG: hypothetical protein SCALA702_09420 [Melioribacteraceae bacterium]|nr:MAG: hypothetical protein SCALA702_09420 [Melioribacteraceae bacterium]